MYGMALKRAHSSGNAYKWARASKVNRIPSTIDDAETVFVAKSAVQEKKSLPDTRRIAHSELFQHRKGHASGYHVKKIRAVLL